MAEQMIAFHRRRPVAWIARRTCAAALAAAFAAGAPAVAQSDYPSRPVQLVVPYGPGGVADVAMRIAAEKLSARLKRQFVVENRPGAGGIAAATAVARAAPDGYTLLMTGNPSAISASLFKALPYNVLSDFAAISTVSFFEPLILTRAGSPLKSVRDIVEAARANPGKLTIGTIVPGSTQEISAPSCSRAWLTSMRPSYRSARQAISRPRRCAATSISPSSSMPRCRG